MPKRNKVFDVTCLEKFSDYRKRKERKNFFCSWWNYPKSFFFFLSYGPKDIPNLRHGICIEIPLFKILLPNMVSVSILLFSVKSSPSEQNKMFFEVFWRKLVVEGRLGLINFLQLQAEVSTKLPSFCHVISKKVAADSFLWKITKNSIGRLFGLFSRAFLV